MLHFTARFGLTNSRCGLLHRLRGAWAVAAITATAALAGCDRPPKDTDAKTWTPADHDHIEEKSRIAQGGQPQSAAQDPAAQAAQVVDQTWRQMCGNCHGPIGKGDGPSAPMFKPADLTREDWQAKVTDEEIAATVRTGKGKMPKFELPEPILKGLIERIRFYRGK